jgi:outer membrane receptor protein involved in Fe transport
MSSVLATGWHPVTYAQQTPAASTALEEIQVTGSRIRVVDGMTAPTPVTAITTDELSNFDPGTTIAAQLDDLPQFFDTQNAQRGNISGISTTGGGSYLNLRGMGQSRTLVLLDGTRVAPADAYGSVNVDLFPSSLVQRIDVVTGGASAAYGADAVAGVVNFILDREFEGLKTRVSTGVTERGDGANYSVSVAGGTSFFDDRLHFIGSVESRKIDQVGPNSRDRLDNWKEWGLVLNPEWVSAASTPNVPQRITRPYVFSAQQAPTGLIITNTNGFAYRNYTFTNDGTGIRPYNFGDYYSTRSGTLNNQSGGPEYIQTLSRQRGPRGNGVDQHSFFGGLKFDVNERLRLTAQAATGSSESSMLGQNTDMSSPGSLYAWNIYRENPYLPQVLATEMDRVGIDRIQMSVAGIIGGPGLINIYDNRGDYSKQKQTQYTLGFDFDIDDNWNLTGSYQTSASTVTTGILNIPRIDKFFLAMDAVGRRPGFARRRSHLAQRNLRSDQRSALW